MPRSSSSFHRFQQCLRTYRWILVDTFLFCAGVFLLSALHHQIWPDSGLPVTYTVDATGQTFPASVPLKLPNGPSVWHVTMPLSLSALHPTVFLLQADDCVRSLHVNGTPVPDALWSNPTCDYAVRKRINLQEFLHAGANTVDVGIANNGGDSSLSFAADRLDPLMLAVEGAAALLVGWYLLMWYGHAARFWRRQAGFVWVALFGIFLRLLYLVSTSPFERGYDTDGHIEYVQYMLSHWNIPLASAGWQFYQPPLYYLVSAAWLSLRLPMQFVFGPSVAHLQLLAALLSCVTVLLLVPLSQRLFPKQSDTRFALLFMALAACVPSLVFLSSRINNDVLYTCLSVLCFLLLVRWWQSGRTEDWFVFILAVAFALLTKTNAAVLLMVGYLCLFCARMPLAKKILIGISSALIITLLVGWLFAIRMKALEGNLIVGNAQSLNIGLHLPPFSVQQSLLSFRPLELLRQPYNNPFDIPRSANLGEYVYRSIFFGEFDLGVHLRLLASGILVAGYSLVPFLLIGLFVSLRKHLRQTLPVWLTLGALASAQIAYRILAPYSCSEDFRFILVSILPVAYFVTVGIRSLPGLWRRIGWFCALCFIAACTLLIASVFWTAG